MICWVSLGCCVLENISKSLNNVNYINKVETFQQLISNTRNVISSVFSLIYETAFENNHKGSTHEGIPSLKYVPRKYLRHKMLFSSQCSLKDPAVNNSRKENSVSFDIGGDIDEHTKNIQLDVISSQLQERTTWIHLSRPNQVIHFDDILRKAKYFLLRIEPQMILALIISFGTDTGESLQSPNYARRITNFYIDAEEVSQFMREIAQDSTCSKVFASFKGMP